MTVKDLIYAAFRLNGVLKAAGRGASPENLRDGLDALNTMLDSWATERLLVYQILRNEWPLTANKQTYTLGPGAADWDTGSVPRPVKIERASQMVMSNPALPIELPIRVLTLAQWQAIPVKNIPTPLITGIYIDGAFPIANVSTNPLPSESTNPLVLYTWGAIGNFASVDDAVEFPQGYRRAIETNLAVELSPRYPETKLSPLVLAQAADSKGAIKRVNMPVTYSRCDSALLKAPGGNSWNIYSGEPYRQ